MPNHEHYMDVAKSVSKMSKDPSTKVGCIIVNASSGSVISTGYNGFPRKAEDNSRLHVREAKYALTVHAEQNAITNAARHGIPLENSTLYVYGAPCCEACALLIVQVGVKTVVESGIAGCSDATKELWIERNKISQQIFSECGIIVQNL